MAAFSRFNKFTSIAIVLAATVGVSACGDGDIDSGNTIPTGSKATGLWVGNYNSGVINKTLVVADGSFYNFFTNTNGSLLYGINIGNGIYNDNQLNSNNGLDINFEGAGISAIVVNAKFAFKQSFNAVNGYANGATVSYQGRYDKSSDLNPNVAGLAATYAGDAALIDVNSTIRAVTTELIIKADGTMSATVPNCTITGTINPHLSGNAYNITWSKFQGTSCPTGVSTAQGHAFYDPSNKYVYAAALNMTRNGGMIFLGKIK